MKDLMYEYKGRLIKKDMSDAMNIIYAIQSAIKVIDTQKSLINGYITSNTQKMQQIKGILSGSKVQADRKMLAQLQANETSLRESLRKLDQARECLIRVESLT
jgi:hypothetical protein